MSRLTIKKGGPLLPAVTMQMWKFWHILAIKGCQSVSHWHLSDKNLRNNKKHCQRYNGPKGWVHITRSRFTVHKSWSYYNFRISIKHKLQNLNQTSVSRLNLKLKSWPKLASEYCPRLNFVTSTKYQQQNPDQICNKLLPTRSSSATATPSTSFELATSHARVTSIKFTKRQLVS